MRAKSNTVALLVLVLVEFRWALVDRSEHDRARHIGLERGGRRALALLVGRLDVADQVRSGVVRQGANEHGELQQAVADLAPVLQLEQVDGHEQVGVAQAQLEAKEVAELLLQAHGRGLRQREEKRDDEEQQH